MTLIPRAAQAAAAFAYGATQAGSAAAQHVAPVTRAEAVAAAATQGARLALARADTAVATAQLLTARAWQNPALSASYSKSVPSYHYALDIPLDLPMQRGARIGSARAARQAALYRFAFERAAAALDADTTYTRALATRDRARLSRRTAQAADSLRGIAVARRDAGDASDLDVALATVAAGQATNVAAADSLTYLSTVLDLQAVMGLTVDAVAIAPADSLTLPSRADLPADSGLPTQAAPLQVAAAQAALEAARLAARLQHRSVFSGFGVMAGIETGGDSAESGILPTVGLSVAIPLLNRNRGPIAQAEAERTRARAELAFAETRSRVEIARARRETAIAAANVARDTLLTRTANQVAAMSLTAYAEGAASLANVLEAQRSTREVLAQYVDDVAALWIAAARLRLLSLTVAGTP